MAHLLCIMIAMAAAAVYIVGWRISGRFGGLASGLLTACAPVYVSRTCYGRFDTDMFVVLMELLLIFFVTKTLRASFGRSRILPAAGFVLTAGASERSGRDVQEKIRGL